MAERPTLSAAHNEETTFANVQPSRTPAALTLRYIRSEGAAPAAEAEIGAIVAVAHSATMAALLSTLPPTGEYAAEKAAAERAVQRADDDAGGTTENMLPPHERADSFPLPRDATAWTVRAAGVDVILPLNGGDAGAQRALTFSLGKLSVHSAEGGLCRWVLRHVSASVISAPAGPAPYQSSGVPGSLPYHQPHSSRSRPSSSRQLDPSHRSFDPETSVSVLRPVILQGNLRLPVHGSQVMK